MNKSKNETRRDPLGCQFAYNRGSDSMKFSDGLRLSSERNQCDANQFSGFISHSTGLIVDSVTQDGDAIVVTAHAGAQMAMCPLCCSPSAAMLFWASLASGQITMRKVDGWRSLNDKPSDQTIDLAA